MKRLFLAVIVLSLVGCAAKLRKPCQVERICFAHRQATLAAINPQPSVGETDEQASERVELMKDLLKTIAELEQETGNYR